MSASENKAATQAAYQAFGAGDLEGAMKDMAEIGRASCRERV